MFYTLDDDPYAGVRRDFMGGFKVYDEEFSEIKNFTVATEQYETYTLVKRREPVTDPFTGNVTYTGDWTVSREYEEDITEYPAVGLIVRSEQGMLSPLEGGASLFLSQTLFNEDEKFEYVCETSEVVESRSNVTERDRDADGEIDEVTTPYRVYSTGVEIRQEDGTVLFRCDYGGMSFSETLQYLYDVGGKKFLVLYGEGFVGDEYQYKSWIYSVDKEADKIMEVKTLSGLRAWPSPLQKGETLTVQLPAASGNGRNVRVVSMDGRVLSQREVAADERSIQLPLQGVPAGVYNLAVEESGRPVAVQRIIVQ